MPTNRSRHNTSQPEPRDAPRLGGPGLRLDLEAVAEVCACEIVTHGFRARASLRPSGTDLALRPLADV